MKEIYYYCIGIGLIILVLTLVLDFLDNVFDIIFDFDFLDIDIGNLEICILPISVRALCMASVLFGSISLLLISKPMVFRSTIAGVVAYISAVILQTITKYLKKHQTLASDKEILLLSISTVAVTIPKDGYGCISTKRNNDSKINTTAKSEDDSEIRQGTEVKVVEIKENYVIVKPL